MKLFKKLLAVTLVAVLALTVFTACDAGNAEDIPSDTTSMRYWQELNNQATAYNPGDGTVLTSVKYSKDLSDYTWQKLNAYINLKNKRDNSILEYTSDEVTDFFDDINDKCKSEKKYEATVYVVGTGTPNYKILYQTDAFGSSSTSRFLNADYIGIARIENKQDGKTYTMMECYQEVR